MSVGIETVHEAGRSDILIETSRGELIVEAKIDATDPKRQSRKYPAKWRVLLSQYHAARSERSAKGTRYLRWRDLLPVLEPLSKSSRADLRFLAGDLMRHLEEHNLIKRTDPMEIYAREINNEETLELFLKGQLYSCKFEKGSQLPEAVYFAPHFGQKIAKEHPGVQVGISYIAKIEEVEVAESMKDFEEVAKKTRNAQWVKKYGSLWRELLAGPTPGKSPSCFWGLPASPSTPRLGRRTCKRERAG